MIGSLKDFLSILSYIESRWSTKKGYRLSLAFLVVTEAAIVLQTIGLSRLKHSTPLEWLALAVVLVSPILLLTYCWLSSSGRIVRKRKNKPYRIVFCIKRANAESEQYFQSTLGILKHLLRECNLLSKFHILDIGYDILDDKEQALEYAKKNSINIVFLGEIVAGKQAGEDIQKYVLDIVRKEPSDLSPAFRNVSKHDANLFFSGRDWNIRHVDSMKDQESVAGSFHEVILFLVALSQITSFKFAETNIKILELLHARLHSQSANDKPIFKDKGKKVTLSITLFRRGRIAALLKELYTELGRISCQSNEFEKSIEYLQKAYPIPAPDRQIPVLMLLAFSSYRLGKVEDAKKYTDEISKINPDDPVFLINRAFFGLLDREYNKALGYYQKFAFSKAVNGVLANSVLEFLLEHRDRNKGEPGFVFALGLVNYAHQDRQLGRTDLHTFTQIVEGQEQYQQMVEFANDLIKLRYTEAYQKYLRRRNQGRNGRKKRKRGRR